MDIHQAAIKAENLLQECGLYQKGWRFKLDRTKNRLGACDYRNKTISVSKNHIIHGTDEEVMDTILHELAHAWVGPGHGHNEHWKAVAEALGAIPASTVRLSYPQQYKYSIFCDCCKRTIQRRHNIMSSARLKTRVCRRCGIDSLGKLKLVINK